MEFVAELTYTEALSAHEALLFGGIARARRLLAGLLFERRYGARTAGLLEPHELGIEVPGAYRYEPSGWLTLPMALPRREVGPDDVLVDLGCGMGRVVLQAARRYRFKRVVGVELSADLLEVARRNVAAQQRLKSPNVELVAADAAEWRLPADATIVYMHNPFTGELFGRVLERLLDHVDRSGRPLKVIYLNPVEEAQLLATGRARELPLPRTLVSRIRPTSSQRLRRFELAPQT
jgi:SAM-dependent methyltransferase